MRLGLGPQGGAREPTRAWPYLAFLNEAVDHAKDEVGPEHVQQLQQQQKGVEEVVAEEGARGGDGLVVRGVQDPAAGVRQEGEAPPPAAPEPSMAPHCLQSNAYAPQLGMKCPSLGCVKWGHIRLYNHESQGALRIPVALLGGLFTISFSLQTPAPTPPTCHPHPDQL